MRARDGNIRTTAQRDRRFARCDQRAIGFKDRTPNALLLLHAATIIVRRIGRRHRARSQRGIVRHRRACNCFPLERLAHGNVISIRACRSLHALHADFIAVINVRREWLREKHRRSNFLTSVVAEEIRRESVRVMIARLRNRMFSRWNRRQRRTHRAIETRRSLRVHGVTRSKLPWLRDHRVERSRRQQVRAVIAPVGWLAENKHIAAHCAK